MDVLQNMMLLSERCVLSLSVGMASGEKGIAPFSALELGAGAGYRYVGLL